MGNVKSKQKMVRWSLLQESIIKDVTWIKIEAIQY